jgi:hypothetical protein
MKNIIITILLIHSYSVYGQDIAEYYRWSHRLPNSRSIFGLHLRLPFGSLKSTKTIYIKHDSTFYYKYGIDLMRVAEGTFKKEGKMVFLIYTTPTYRIDTILVEQSLNIETVVIKNKVPMRFSDPEADDWPYQLEMDHNKLFIIKTLRGTYKRPLVLKEINNE